MCYVALRLRPEGKYHLMDGHKHYNLFRNKVNFFFPLLFEKF